MSPVAQRETAAELSLRRQVDEYRLNRLRRVDSILDLASGAEAGWRDDLLVDLPLRYALAHHLLESAEDKVTAGELADVRRTVAVRRQPATLRLIGTPVGMAAAVRAGESALITDTERSRMPFAILGAELCAATAERERDIARAALATGHEAGFGALLHRNSRVVVLLKERALGEEMSSWTTSRLPGTVHLDYHSEHYFVTRDLVHEAAHTALNDLFTALQVTLPDEVTFFAPWRDQQRPVFGFLHGVWAFAHVVLYLDWLTTADVPRAIRAMARAMRERHAGQLVQTRDDAERGLELVSDTSLAELMARRRDEAIDTFRPARSG